ncbi:hypothetical protein GOP47_0015906 [Adiantum capillus-veneris]|uniref:Uncharacterized protein n=1 Tax=Adiantum capillus-veneris TaxID=13818 RepID=A0A9D4UKN5_ADICA|nr:hypothetical protein GOP47_0015906 [Adiantum capillus-veneris]
MAARLAPPRGYTERSHAAGLLCEDAMLFRGNAWGGDRVPGSSYKITPYGHETTYPYGHYERPINREGPLDDIKQKIRDSRDQKLAVKEEDDCCSDSDASDGELDESPRHHKVKKLGVL